MNSIMICIYGLFFAILVNTVSGTCEDYPATHGTLEAPFTFAYMLSAEFNLIVRLKNTSPRITRIAVTIYTDGQLNSKKEWDPIGDEYRVCGDASLYNRVTVGLELYSPNGLCATRLVSDGKHVRTLDMGVADSTYKSINFCLNFSSACAIEMDLRHGCIEIPTDPNASRKKSYVTPKMTQNIPDTTSRTPITPKRKITYTPQPTNKHSDNTRHSPITPKPNNTRRTPITYTRKITETQKSSNERPGITRYTPNTPKQNNTRHTPITPKQNNTRHTPITPKRNNTRHTPSTLNINNTRHTPITPKSNNYPQNKTRHTPTTPKRTIPDTLNISNEHTDNKIHTPITLKPTIYNTPYIPDNDRNTSRTPKHKISGTPKPNIEHSEIRRHTPITPKPIIYNTPIATWKITDTTTSITPKAKILYTPIATQNISDTLKPTHNISDGLNKSIMSGTPKATQKISDTQQAAQNKWDNPNGTQLTSNSSKTLDLRNDDADVKKYITITIISGVSLMVLIVIVVIVRKCCCIKYNPSGSSQLLTNDIGSPFYLNMLFRKECDQEIERIEQHHYEEIRPDRVSATAANVNGD